MQKEIRRNGEREKKREWVEREKEVNAYVSKTNLIYN